MRKRTVTVKIDTEILELIDEYAVKHSQTRSDVIRRAIMELVEKKILPETMQQDDNNTLLARHIKVVL